MRDANKPVETFYFIIFYFISYFDIKQNSQLNEYSHMIFTLHNHRNSRTDAEMYFALT